MDRHHRVAIHINEQAQWPMVLANANNAMADSRMKSIDVVVVANGSAVKSYVQECMPKEMKQSIAMGIQFRACANALRGNGIVIEALGEGIVVVESGVGELVLLQSQGYAYLKP